MEHRIVSLTLGKIVAEVSSTIVSLDYSRMKSVPVPEPVLLAIAELEGHGEGCAATHP
jgi:acyl-CoA thioesterase FadM